jgi:hypothetical protein
LVARRIWAAKDDSKVAADPRSGLLLLFSWLPLAMLASHLTPPSNYRREPPWGREPEELKHHALDEPEVGEEEELTPAGVNDKELPHFNQFCQITIIFELLDT